MARSLSFQVRRIPDEFGPQLLCKGELTIATVGSLSDELDLFVRSGHAALILDFSEISLGDVSGSVRLIEVLRNLAAAHRPIAIVIGSGTNAVPLSALEIGASFPLFSSTEEAQSWLRGGVDPAPAPGTWIEARDETLHRWRAIQASMGGQPMTEVQRQLTSLTSLCEKADSVHRDSTRSPVIRCRFCPLFHLLGGEESDLGCRSAVDPILDDVRGGDLTAAQTKLGQLIQTVETLPLPKQGWPPPDWLPIPPE